jgi:hypothetical protein
LSYVDIDDKLNVKKQEKDDYNKTVEKKVHFYGLNSHIRNKIFQTTKFLDGDHLHVNDEIMQSSLEICKYNKEVFSTEQKFFNDLRTEIKAVVCSRRGYVKRQIGLLMRGTLILKYED